MINYYKFFLHQVQILCGHRKFNFVGLPVFKKSLFTYYIGQDFYLVTFFFVT